MATRLVVNEGSSKYPETETKTPPFWRAAYGSVSNDDLVQSLENRIRQLGLGLPVPFLPYHRPAPVTTLLGRTVEHLALLKRVLADGVPQTTVQGWLLEERRHYRLPVVGAVLVDVRGQVA